MIDTTYLAAAALQPDGIGPCNCKHHTNDGKPSKQCPACHGTGKLTACLECEGSGWNPKRNTVCSKCEGHGYR
jgi:DnaJ-class molecular chaperone